MTIRSATAAAFLWMLAPWTLAATQDATPAAGPAPAPMLLEQGSPAAAGRAEGVGAADADARACLELQTNLQVIACAEKYRPHRKRAPAR